MTFSLNNSELLKSRVCLDGYTSISLCDFFFPTVVIDSIYKVTEGRQSEIFHRHAEGSFDPSCCFTIYHGNHLESLDLITSNPEEARTWITGLKYLMAGISDEDSLAKRQRTHDQYPFTNLSTGFQFSISYLFFSEFGTGRSSPASLTEFFFATDWDGNAR